MTVLAAPECSELKSRWYGHYAKDFAVGWDTDTFVCPGQEGDLALTMNDLETADFNPNPDGYRPEFYRRVTDKLWSLRYDKSCDDALASTNPVINRITLCPAFFTDTREDRASTLVHESWHLDLLATGHTTCHGGRFDGDSGACDAEFFDGTWKGGGYNADIFYLGWTLRASRRNELSQSVLQSTINKIVPDRFNQISPEQTRHWRAD